MAPQNSKGDSDEKAIPAVESAFGPSRTGEGASLSSIPGGKSQQFADTVKEGWSSGREKATSLAHTAQDYALGWYDTAKELAGSAGESASVVVRRYPIVSVVAGFGIGYLLGALLKRRR